MSRRDATQYRAGHGWEPPSERGNLFTCQDYLSVSGLRLVVGGRCSSGNPEMRYPPLLFPEDIDSRHSRNIIVDAVQRVCLKQVQATGIAVEIIPRLSRCFLVLEGGQSRRCRRFPAPQTCGVGPPRSASPWWRLGRRHVRGFLVWTPWAAEYFRVVPDVCQD